MVALSWLFLELRLLMPRQMLLRSSGDLLFFEALFRLAPRS